MSSSLVHSHFVEVLEGGKTVQLRCSICRMMGAGQIMSGLVMGVRDCTGRFATRSDIVLFSIRSSGLAGCNGTVRHSRTIICLWVTGLNLCEFVWGYLVN